MINRETKNKLAEIQQKHRELERRRNTIGENIRPIREKMALINAKHLVAIGTMKDEKGRLLYPTEKIRQAALTVALSEDAEYQRLKEEPALLSSEEDTIRQQRSYLQDQKDLLLLNAGVIPPHYRIPMDLGIKTPQE